jgi:geranylgeranyl diphosphate synthase, type II
MSNTKTPETRRSRMYTLTNRVQTFIIKYGENGYQIAKKAILDDNNLTEPVKQVLKYFIEECWPNRQHPALISAACEAVGGKRDTTEEVSASMVLLTGAADIHDDIIDKSKVKSAKPTAYGKFNQDVTLLAGDILLLKALTLLGTACEKFPLESRQTIRRLVEEAFVEIGCATAKEREYKGNFSLDPKRYWKIILAKGAVSEAFARVGAILGNGQPEEVEALGHFGRTLGILMTVENEFLDMVNSAELGHRAKYEVLPLPVCYALQNEAVKKEILKLLAGRITRKDTQRIGELVMSTEQVQELNRKTLLMARNEENALNSLKGNKTFFMLLLQLSVKPL